MDIHREIITKNAQETKDVGERLAGERPKIVCLYGELGSGKTTFSQGFAKGLGITKRLLSPTFIIVRRYDLPRNFFLYHIDLYRIQTIAQMEVLGLPEIFVDPFTCVIIEWAQRLEGLLPKSRIDIYFSVFEDGKHKISIR